MKNFFRSLMFGLLMLAVTSVAVVPSYAQDDELAKKTALYEKYTSNYNGTVEQMKIALEAGREYVQKYGANADDKPQVDFIKADIPRLEAAIEADRKAKIAAAEAARKNALYGRFDSSVKSKNWAETYKAGREILAEEPNLVDVILVLGSIGLDESQKNPPVTTFNNDTIQFANLAISKLNSGVESKNYGAYQFAYKNKDFPDGKSNALGWMNYTIGYIMYYRMNKKQEAIPYLYKATQFNSGTKSTPAIYATIGDEYFSTVVKMQDERDKWDKTEEGWADKVKQSVAKEKAYVDRAIDAYARAYALVRANPKTPAVYKANILKVLKDLYEFRYQKPEMKTISKINADVTSIVGKPMPNPATTPTVETPAMDKTTEATDGTKTGNTRSRMATPKTSAVKNQLR
ncbi:MAG: hypothetical protein HKN25_04275 [Pyrinomonadaceae bacterium]|nr:hypothetical protein [Pyrinomonadaceae bacterium]